MNYANKRMAPWCIGVLGLAGAAILPGCSAAPTAEEGNQSSAFVVETAEQAQAREQSNAGQATAGDQGVPGEASEEESASGAQIESKQNCVYIQWCNEPGGWGTVCRVRSSCVNQCSTNLGALVNECTADANYVCGGITQPAVIRGCP